MKKDLSDVFRIVGERLGSWDQERFHSLLKAVESALPTHELDLEPDDEAWLRILDKEVLVAILRVEAPLAFTIGAGGDRDVLSQLFDETGVVMIHADSWEEEEFTLTSPSTRAAIGLVWADGSESTPTDSFSLNDLWYETI